MDLLKAIGVSVTLLILIQFLPIGQSASTITTIIIAGAAFWSIALAVKLFTSFTGHNIRYILDENGATAVANEGKIGLSYVAKQVSTLRSLEFGSDDVYLPWGQVTGIGVDVAQKVISLNKGDLGSIHLYCSSDNFDTILETVNARCSLAQEIV